MLEARTAVSEDYDTECVNGEIVRRAMPTFFHSLMQRFLILKLDGNAERLLPLPEQRIRMSGGHRVPDVCLTRERPKGDGMLLEPPFLCIEILSPDDVFTTVMEKVDEYLAFGVQWVWVINPTTGRGFIWSHDRIEEVKDGVFFAGEIVVDVKSDPERTDWTKS